MLCFMSLSLSVSQRWPFLVIHRGGRFPRATFDVRFVYTVCVCVVLSEKACSRGDAGPF